MNRLPLLPELWRDRVFRVAVLVAAGALITMAAAATGALRLQSVADAPIAPTIPDSLLRFDAPESRPDVAAAVARDLFQDDRTPAALRYRLPGEPDVVARDPAPRPAVLGTAIGTGKADFAVCQVAGGQPAIVRAGARMGEFTVLSIERNRVWFRGADGERFFVDATKPVP